MSEIKENPDYILNSILTARNLNNVNRYSLSRVNRQQNVSEHSFGVIIFAELIFNDLRKYFEINYKDQLNFWDSNFELFLLSAENYLLKLALFHDFGEAVTGDIIYPFKNSNYYNNESEVDYIIEKYSKTVFNSNIYLMVDLPEKEEILQKRFEKFLCFMPFGGFFESNSELLKKFFNELELILKLCDALELVFYTWEEKLSGNKLIDPIFETGKKLISNERYNFVLKNSFIFKEIKNELEKATERV